MYAIDPVTAAALQGDPQLSVRVQVITPTGAQRINVIEDQSAVSYDVSSMQARNASIVVTRDIIDAGLLNVLTDHVYINLNVSGGQDIPLFYGRAQKTQGTQDGHVQVTCIDDADDLVGYSFMAPWSTHGGTVGNEIQLLIQTANAAFSVDMSRVPQQMASMVPVLTWEDERTKAIDDLARGVLCMWHARRQGGFEFFPNPFILDNYTPVASFTDGANGTFITMQDTTSREEVYNSITLIVERSDGTNPIRVTVYDNDPNSDTYVQGPFGVRNKNYTIQTPIDENVARSLATLILRASLALSATWSWSVPCFPHIDPADIVSLTYRNFVSPVMVETVAIPLSGKQPTQFSGRKLHLIDPSVIGIIGV